jgi:hypothetical protein
MTVKELREALAAFDERAKVVVSWEENGNLQLFEIDETSIHKGIPKRHPDGKAGFEFAQSGQAEWVFIAIDHA